MRRKYRAKRYERAGEFCSSINSRLINRSLYSRGKCAAGKLKARDNYGNGRFRRGDHLSDILTETAGKLGRLIIELARLFRAASELWQNRNKRRAFALNAGGTASTTVSPSSPRLSFGRAGTTEIIT